MLTVSFFLFPISSNVRFDLGEFKTRVPFDILNISIVNIMLTVTFILFIGVIFLNFALLFLKYENS